MASSNTTNTSYGTTQPEKGKLPFYNVLSRSSTDSTRSTDALLQSKGSETKKEKDNKVSTKAIMDSAYKNAMRPSM